MDVWHSPEGTEIAVIATTWELNPKITFESLADEFKRNPQKAWRNYGSVVTLNIEAAIKDMGAWDNPDQRAKMIKSYAKYDRENKGRN